MKIIKVTTQVNYKDSVAYVIADNITYVRETNDETDDEYKTLIYFAKDHNLLVKETQDEVFDLINAE